MWFILVLLQILTNSFPTTNTISEKSKQPMDEFYAFRQFGQIGEFSIDAYVKALAEVKNGNRSGIFNEPWKQEGPGNIGARVNCIAVHPTNPQIIFIGYSHGGAFRTKDGGQTWQSVFENNEFLSIGCITIDPKNPNIIYLGTGDPNISGYPFIGNGIFKSIDGGNTWVKSGLSETFIISQITINPKNSNVLYACTMGLPFKRTQDRGLYKSTDAGKTWSKVLYLSDGAGVSALLINPQDTNILYAAGWDRLRSNSVSIVSGENSKLMKSVDAGKTWTTVKGGLPETKQCRLALAMSETNPNKIYVRYIGENLMLNSIFKTVDGGNQWDSLKIVPVRNAFSNFGWYFGSITLNPKNDDELYLLAVGLHKTSDNGANWTSLAYDVHADLHDFAFLPDGKMLVASDGGLYKSDDNTATNWTKIENNTCTQFYRVAYNPTDPSILCGGAQDNGTNIGNASIKDEWEHIFGGDGFQTVYHPTDPDRFYCEYQNGAIFMWDGIGFENATKGISNSEEKHWDMQYIMSPHNPNVLYTATSRIYRSESATTPNWKAISGKITDSLFSSRYHMATTLSESPITEKLLYVGTGDGKLWKTTDLTKWTAIESGLPKKYITCVKTSPTLANTVYVSFSGYRDNDFSPNIFKSDDQGATWKAINANLPQLAINDILIVPKTNDKIMFVGTDGGVYGTIDGGQNWERVGSNMPIIPIYDLEYNVDKKEIFVATFARSIQSYPIKNLLTSSQTLPLVQSLTIANNLTQHSFFIQIPTLQNYDLEIMDLSGKSVKKMKIEGTIDWIEMNISNFAAGTYIVSLSSDKQKYVGKVVKM